MNDLTRRIAKHEGLRLHPYQCPANKITIGYGRNLEDRGITKDEAMYLLQNDITDIKLNLVDRLPIFTKLNTIRQEVLIEMCYQIGINGVLKFRNMIKALNNANYQRASIEMLDSRWAKQTPSRAKELSNLMKGGI